MMDGNESVLDKFKDDEFELKKTSKGKVAEAEKIGVEGCTSKGRFHDMPLTGKR